MQEERKNKQSSSLGINKDMSITTQKCSILSLYLWTIRRMVHWAPPPLDGGNYESMNAYKQQLKTMADLDIKTIIKGMELCFPLRRKEINSGVSLHCLKKEYPFMFTCENILKEFQLLMLIDAKKAFFTNASHIAPILIKLVRQRRHSQEIVKILNLIPSEKNSKDEIIACLLILPYLFSVSSSLVYNIYDENTPVHIGPDSIQEGPNYPHVAVMGNPFSCSEAYVVAEGEILIECSEFIEAVIACMAIYYCCNIEYPKEAIDTYLFIQTQFLKLEHHGEFPQKITMLLEKIKKDGF